MQYLPDTDVELKRRPSQNKRKLFIAPDGRLAVPDTGRGGSRRATSLDIAVFRNRRVKHRGQRNHVALDATASRTFVTAVPSGVGAPWTIRIIRVRGAEYCQGEFETRAEASDAAKQLAAEAGGRFVK